MATKEILNKSTDINKFTSYSDLIEKDVVRTYELFLSSYGKVPEDDLEAKRIKIQTMIYQEYSNLREPKANKTARSKGADLDSVSNKIKVFKESSKTNTSNALITIPAKSGDKANDIKDSNVLTLFRANKAIPKPDFHPNWKLMRVIPGHLGWVRCVAVDVSNEWFATGSADRTIKIWDLASGTLKITLTGHIHTVRGLVVSDRHPVGEDKMVKCWDLEYNKVIRSYHGHLSGVYSCAIHPSIDVLITGGRDSCARVWDIRTKKEIYLLGGHTDTVYSLLAQDGQPQVVTGSSDRTMRCWDLRTGKKTNQLTHHKKGIRSMSLHPKYKAEFLYNFQSSPTVINTSSLNENNVLFTGSDNGKMNFYDYKTGYNFQSTTTIAQPGSLDSENGIFGSSYDRTGTRLITCEADKTIKMWKEDPDCSEENTPINMKDWEIFYRRPTR